MRFPKRGPVGLPHGDIAFTQGATDELRASACSRRRPRCRDIDEAVRAEGHLEGLGDRVHLAVAVETRFEVHARGGTPP